jgi:HEAT repeat protein
MFYSPLPRTLAAALRDLKEDKPTVRAAAVRDLVRHVEEHRAEVARGLEEALHDEAAIVRATAAEAVGDAGIVEGVEWLLVAMEDDSPIARQNSICALGLLRDERAEPALLRALADERPDVRFQATMAYARVAPREAALDALLARTRDEDDAIVHIALRMTEELVTLESGAPADVDERVLARARACLRHDSPSVRVVAAIIVAAAGREWGDATLVDAATGKLGPIDNEDLAEAIELVAERDLRGAQAGLAVRARSGFMGLSQDPCQWQARVALARFGDEKERKHILRELGASSYAKRTVAVSAAGRAMLREAQPILEGMVGQPERADQDAVREALRLLERT